MAENEEALVKAEALQREGSVVIDLKDMEDGEYQPEYEVELQTKPAGFFFKKNFILYVFENGAAEEAKVLPYSRVLKVNDTPIEQLTNHFREVFLDTPAPMRLTLQTKKQAGAMDIGGESKGALTSSDKFKLLMVYMSVAIDVFGAMMVIPVLPFLAKQLALSDAQLGLVLGVYQLAAIPGSLMTLRIAMWKGTKFGILFSILGSAITLVLQGFAWNFPSLIFFRVCAGLTGSSMPVAITHIGIVVPNHLKAIWMSYIGVCITSALVVGPAFGGSLVGYGLGVPYYVGGGMAFLGFFVVLLFLPNLQIPKITANSAKTDGKLEAPNFACWLLSILKPIPFTAFAGMIGNYLLKVYGLSGQDVGIVMSIQGVWSSLNTIILYPLISKRLSLAGTYTLGAFLMGVGFLGAAMMTEWIYFLCFTVILVGGGFGYMTSSLSPLADSWATPYTRPKVHSYASILDSLGFMVGSTVWGNVFQYGMSINQSNIIWLAASGSAFFAMIAGLLINYCVLQPRAASVAIKKKNDDAQRAKNQEHKISSFKPDEGTLDERMILGNMLGDLLHKKGFDWVKYTASIGKLLDKMIPDLPSDTMENRFATLKEMNSVADLVEQSYSTNKQDDVHGAFDRLRGAHKAHRM